VPTVLVTRDLDSHALPLVAADDAEGVADAIRHLAELGHRAIAHVTGPLSLSTTSRRLQAFEAESASLGLRTEGMVIHGDAFTTRAGRSAAERLLHRGREFTAILAGNDLVALGCMEALAEAGLRCPDDVSIVGHNDTPLVDSVQPPLTTVAIPQERIGAEAARLLLRRFEGDDADAGERVLLPTELIVRGSTAPVLEAVR
jgi:LacI family transcriptional regulator